MAGRSTRPHPCAYCPKGFNTTGGLQTHLKTCANRVQAFADTFSKRKAGRDERAQAQKRAKTDEVEVEGQFEEHMVLGDAPPLPQSPPGPRSRSGRRVKVPKIWKDMAPLTRHGLPSQIANAFPQPPPSPMRPPPSPSPAPDPDPSQASQEHVMYYDLPPDAFGVNRRYTTLPCRDPEDAISIEDLCDAPSLAGPRPSPATYKSIRWINRPVDTPASANPYEPFENKSTFLLCDWHYNRSNTKSLRDLDDLVGRLRTPGFSTAELGNFSARREMNHLDQYQKASGIFSAQDGWHNVTLELPTPQTGEKFASEVDVPKFPVKGLHCRRLLEVVVGELQDSRFAQQRHWFPYERYWRPPPSDAQPTDANVPPSPVDDVDSAGDEHPNTPPPAPPDDDLIHMISDTFDSRAMLEAHEEIQRMPRDPDDPADFEYAVVPLLLYSDSTHLASFGSASLWPIYMWIGNISKYIRGKRGAFTAQHVAYMPSLPDDIQDFYKEQYGRTASAETLRWLRCELMQKIWAHLLDDEEFKKAYKHGIVIECADGVLRRIFPRFFTYSADYPEKALIIAMRHLGQCPCPRCLIKMKQILAAGTTIDDQRRSHKRQDTQPLHRLLDRVRGWAFEGRPLAGKAVKRPLLELSLFPIRSAFSKFLFEMDANFYEIFAPDLMHEFELGVWKGIFNHILRILVAEGNDSVAIFNERMRKMPTFGHGTIRRFRTNVSRQNKLAARDYEAFLHVIIPVIEGLLPQRHCDIVTDLLFELANWHALAKLRLHTTVTLEIFRKATRLMYAAVRKFARTTCKEYVTFELDREAEARGRRQARAAATRAPGAVSTRTAVAKKDPKAVVFRVWHTYKYHCLGDYPEYIERYGCTDCTTTQTGECEHIGVKDYYDRTNKNAFVEQIAVHERRRGLLQGTREEVEKHEAKKGQDEIKRQEAEVADAQSKGKGRAMEPEPEPESDAEEARHPAPYARYTMGRSRKNALNLYNWLAEHDEDPAIEKFIPRLKNHLIARKLRIQDEDTVPEDYRHSLTIRKDKLYQQKTVSFNFTTYDMRRDRDTVNPRSHPDILLLTSQEDEDDFPFAYARVIGIYHAETRYTGPGSTSNAWEKVDFLWVRWFARDPAADSPGGFRHRRLPRLTFLDPADESEGSYPAFGFVDPACVLRGAYIIPGYHHGINDDVLRPDSIGRADGSKYDYNCYYVGMFAGRDMYMRFLGGGVGHNGVGVDVHQSRCRADRLDGAKRKTGPATRAGSETSHDLESSPSASEDEDADIRACMAAEEAIDEALNALQEAADEEEADEPADLLLADPYEDDAIEWGDLFGNATAGDEEDESAPGEDEENEDEDYEPEDDELYADYPPL